MFLFPPLADSVGELAPEPTSGEEDERERGLSDPMHACMRHVTSPSDEEDERERGLSDPMHACRRHVTSPSDEEDERERGLSAAVDDVPVAVGG